MMSEPTPLGLGDLPGLPDGVRQRIRAEDLVEDPHRLGESPAEAAERRARAVTDHHRNLRMWAAQIPKRFQGASLADLTAEQDPGGHIGSWWDNTASGNLVLRSDDSGVGKSHAAYAVGNEAASAMGGGAWVAGWSMIDLNDAIRPGNDETAYSVAGGCDLLILDDVGREQMTTWTLERLQGILDARWRDQRRTVVTTHLTGKAFAERYGDPIVDRLTDGLTLVEFSGVSRRKPAPW